MSIIDLQQALDARTPHIAGAARCMQCAHEWQAMAPTGTDWLECPECRSERGYFIGPVQPEDDIVMACVFCGNHLWLFTPNGALCPKCGNCIDIADIDDG